MSEIVFTGNGDTTFDRAVQQRAKRYAALSDREQRSDRTGLPLRKLYDRVYTSNLRDDPADVIQRNVWSILGHLFPGAVLSGRTAMHVGIARAPGAKRGDPGFVFLTGPYRRNASLPGLEIRMNEGPGRLPGDTDFLGLYVPSKARALLENLASSRARGGGIARTTGRREVEEALVEQCIVAGEESLNEIRDLARELQDPLNAHAEFDELNGIIGRLLRSHENGTLTTPEAIAMAAGQPFDPRCVERLEALFSYLRSNPMPRRPDLTIGTTAATNTAFIEAYFSNYIEGTTFLVAEAEDIVFQNLVPDRRPKDSHDVLATFKMLSDYESMRRTPTKFEDFLALLRARHSQLMAARPDKNPGQFKSRANKTGNTVFVAPDLIMGTFRRGLELMSGLDDPFARALFIHFLVSEVHPFDDGNGRTARIMMASELTAAKLSRIVIPTVYRDEYLAGQRSLTQRGEVGPNFRMLDFAQKITSSIAEMDRSTLIRRWASTHAFVEPGPNARLTDPTDGNDVDFRDGVPAPTSFWEAQGQKSGFGI